MIGIYGSGGYIGSEFVAEMQRRKLEYCDLRAWDHPLPCKGFHSDFRAVINCAALVVKPSVDLNDNHKEETLIGNLVFPSLLAAACSVNKTPLLQVSTGCLFNRPPEKGAGTIRYEESDEPHLTFDKGAGWYVGSKVLAERVVRQYEKHWICRIRLPFDKWDNPRNYLSKLLSYPKIVDTYNSLSHRGDFVKACLDMIEMGVPFGTYNMTNPEAVWAHQIAHMLAKQGLKNTFEYWLMDDFLKTRKTPMSNAELDVSKLLATGVKMRPVQEALEDSIKNWHPALT